VRFVADRIPGSRYVDVDTGGCQMWYFHRPWRDGVVAEIRARVEGIAAPPDDTVLTTLLFTDIVGSTERSSTLGDRAWKELLERHHGIVRRELARFRGREVDTAGDGFFATFDGPARAIRCAHAVASIVAELGIGVRSGVHTGECEIADGKVAGIAVNIAARVTSLADAGDVLVTSTVKDLVAGSGLGFADTGDHQLKGIPSPWRIYRALPERAAG
jgi:class 3 adenylate cyclase